MYFLRIGTVFYLFLPSLQGQAFCLKVSSRWILNILYQGKNKIGTSGESLGRLLAGVKNRFSDGHVIRFLSRVNHSSRGCWDLEDMGSNSDSTTEGIRLWIDFPVVLHSPPFFCEQTEGRLWSIKCCGNIWFFEAALKNITAHTLVLGNLLIN